MTDELYATAEAAVGRDHDVRDLADLGPRGEQRAVGARAPAAARSRDDLGDRVAVRHCGRWTRACALTIRLAAMSSIARVIFFVDWTLRIRRRRIRSWPPAMVNSLHSVFSVLSESASPGASASTRAGIGDGGGVGSTPRCPRRNDVLEVVDRRLSASPSGSAPVSRISASSPAWRDRNHSSSSRSKRLTSSTGMSSSAPDVPDVDRHHLLLDRHRRVQRLLEQLDEALAAVELGARDGVELGTEGRERLELAELREVELERSRRRPSSP